MKIKTMSGIWVEASERDLQWIRWLENHGVCDGLISDFLNEHPTSSPTIEASDLKSEKCGFDSHNIVR